MDPRYLPQTVNYDGSHAPGTVVVDTPNKFLYLVEEGGKAKRYGIGVGRPGFTWAGVTQPAARSLTIRARMTEMIQKRTKTVLSLQPFCS